MFERFFMSCSTRHTRHHRCDWYQLGLGAKIRVICSDFGRSNINLDGFRGANIFRLRYQSELITNFYRTRHTGQTPTASGAEIPTEMCHHADQFEQRGGYGGNGKFAKIFRAICRYCSRSRVKKIKKLEN